MAHLVYCTRPNQKSNKGIGVTHQKGMKHRERRLLSFPSRQTSGLKCFYNSSCIPLQFISMDKFSVLQLNSSNWVSKTVSRWHSVLETIVSGSAIFKFCISVHTAGSFLRNFCSSGMRVIALVEARHRPCRTYPAKKGKSGLESSPKWSEIKGTSPIKSDRIKCQQIHGAYKRRGSPWLKELPQPILNKTLLERFSVFQLSSFNSMSHHPLQPNTSLAIPSTPYSLAL